MGDLTRQQQGRLVSGLHLHTNLKILTGSENSRKRNRYEP